MSKKKKTEEKPLEVKPIEKNKQPRTYKNKNPKDFLQLLEKNLGMITTTCKEYGISRECYYKWLKNTKGFKEAVDDVFEGLKDMGESALYRKIIEGDVKAIIFFNETKNKDRGYVKSSEQKISVDDSTVELVIN